MPQFQIAYNGRTSFYEVHVAGCRHLVMGATGNPYTAKFDYVNAPEEAETALAAAAEFEGGNDGCLTTFGPCASQRAKTTRCTECGRTTGLGKATVEHNCLGDW